MLLTAAVQQLDIKGCHGSAGAVQLFPAHVLAFCGQQAVCLGEQLQADLGKEAAVSALC